MSPVGERRSCERLYLTGRVDAYLDHWSEQVALVASTQTDECWTNLDTLVEQARGDRIEIMCAEAVPAAATRSAVRSLDSWPRVDLTEKLFTTLNRALACARALCASAEPIPPRRVPPISEDRAPRGLSGRARMA